jgi:predicted DNA-binding transcriptional regulator AlpA
MSNPSNADTTPDTFTDWQKPASLIGLKKAAFWQAVHSQGIPCYRINARVIRFKLAEVEAWLSTRRVA